MKEYKFEFNGYSATVITPDKPNGKWIWKTEFLHAFEDAEIALLERGYTRVTYEIHNMWGSFKAVRLMHKFHSHVVEKFNLCKKCILFGFSRGGTYAFNYAITYPESVEKVYLDAPLLALGSITGAGLPLLPEIYEEYGMSAETIGRYKDNPIDNMKEFFSANLPLLLIAGDSDEVVPYNANAGRLAEYARENGIEICFIIKKGGKHHPHGLTDISPIIDFVESATPC